MKRSVSRGRDERRAEILAAAAELFAASGSRGTSIAAVAARVGMTDAGVLHHFRTKEELLLGVLEHFDRTVADQLARSEAGGIDFLEQIGEWGAAMERTPETSALLITLSAEHLVEDSPARDFIRGRYRWVLDRTIAALATAARNGDLRADLDPVAEASTLIAYIDGIRFQWFLFDKSFSMAGSIRTFVDAWLARLRAPAKAQVADAGARRRPPVGD